MEPVKNIYQIIDSNKKLVYFLQSEIISQLMNLKALKA